MAHRLEKIPEPLDLVEDEILDQSVVVVRTADVGVRVALRAVDVNPLENPVAELGFRGGRFMRTPSASSWSKECRPRRRLPSWPVGPG